MWEITLVKPVDWSTRPEDFYGNSAGGESFFSCPHEKIVGAVPVKSEGATMEITVLIQKRI